MYKNMHVKSLFVALLMLAILMVSQSKAVVVPVNSPTTWSDNTTFDNNDSAIVFNDAELTVDGDTLNIAAVGETPATTQKLSVLTIGGYRDASNFGDGSVTIIGGGTLLTNSVVLGRDGYSGHLTTELLSDFSISTATSTGLNNGYLVLNEGTITNNTNQSWSLLSMTWNNDETTAILFNGTATTYIGSNASGEYLELQNGTLSTTGDLDANNFTLTSGTLKVAGELTLDNFSSGTTIELLDGASWTVDSTAQTGGDIVINGGTLDVNFDLDYTDAANGSLSMSDGLIVIHDYDINLGDTADITNGAFDARSLGNNTVSWSGGTVRASTHTFFTDAYYTDNVNVDLSGTAILKVFDNSANNEDDGAYTVVYNLTMTDTATVTGGTDMLLYVQAGASITTTSGLNTADIEFMGRNDKSAYINSGATFSGDITVSNGVSNEIAAGTFNGTVTIENPGDSSTGTSETVPVGVGLTRISGGTFNNEVTLSLYRRTDLDDDEEDEENKVTITGGTFNDALIYSGAGNAAISNAGTLTLGTLELSSGTGTLSITEDVIAVGESGEYSVKLNAAVLSIDAGKTLTVTNGDFIMEEDGTGVLTGDGAVTLSDASSKFYMESGTITDNVTINADVVQSGGSINPGIREYDEDEEEWYNEIGTVTVNGDLELHDSTLKFSLTNSDKIVVSGDITTTSDGTMTIIPTKEELKFVDGTEYTVLTSGTGNITIDEDYSIVSTIGGFRLEGAQVGNDYIITLQRSIDTFPNAARNANNFANYLYDLSAAGDQQNELMKALESDPDQELAAEKLSGESHETALQSLMNVGMMRVHTLTEQIRPTMSSRFLDGGMVNGNSVDGNNAIARGQFESQPTFEQTRVWYAAYGMGGHIRGTASTASTGVTFAGMMVGIEGTYDAGSAKVGLYYDGGAVETDVNQLAAKTKIKTNFFGGYLTRELDNGYRLLTLGFGEDRYSSRRYLDIGMEDDEDTDTVETEINELAKGGYHGWETTLYGERGFDSLGRFTGIQPYIGLQYSYIRRNAFSETGSTEDGSYTDYAMLDMEAANYNSLRTYLGARWETPFYQLGHDTKTGMMLGGTFQVQTIWIHEMLDKTAPINSAQLGMSDLSNTFVVEGADCGRDWYVLSLGTRWQLSRTFSFYGDYTLLLNEQETFHTGSGGLCLTW